MKLTVKDRVVFPGLYPSESSLTDQIYRKDIDGKVRFTQKEIEKYEIKSSSKNITWNPNKIQEKEVEFTKGELNFLKEQVTRLDSNKKITPDLTDVCLKIKNA
ncbi:MAG: hypothetical protein ACTSWG_10270 [Candidatus Helarchaeota archaeon]